MTPEDMALYEAICSDDPYRVELATSKLVRRVRVIVNRIAAGNRGVGASIDDVVQETVLGVWQAMRSGRFEARPETPLDGFLYQVGKNQWLRQGEKPIVPLDLLHEVIPSPEPLEPERGYLLEEAFAQLCEDCKTILHWFYWEGYSMEDIGDRLGILDTAAKTRKYRCIRELGEILRGK